ncbi:MAG: hypothetical protein ACKOD3_00935 [Phenylobacterium sp.]
MTHTPDPLREANEDLTLAMVIYALFIASLMAFPPAAIVGVIMAHAASRTAGPVAASHHRFQIRTFWMGLAAWALAGASLFWGSIFSAILIGIPLFLTALLAFPAIWLWALVRSAVGLTWAAQQDACARPETLTL